ncbi:MAG: aminotransferase class I/II-fold pyridoxal phosphate-dependent enzyme [Lachnospiraceae bacterium]|nr:aminotransferase class I/II-fold pyridoxal phosphate-dependent enzyme [Lachnospiraceae bacterium]
MRCMYRHGGDIYTYKNCLDFSANINFMGMPESVQRAAREAVGASVFYPDPSCGELRRAIAGMEGVSEEMIFCGNGAADVIFTLTRAVRPRRALLPVPSFYEYRQALCAAGCGIITYRMREEDGFRLREDIPDHISQEIDMMLLCNPNNPTGLLTERDFLERVLRRCEAAGTLLVVDECFMDLTPEPERYTMLPSAADSDRLFILKAFTKTFAMPGLRLGYGICRNRSLLEKMESVSQPWRVSVPAQAAGIAAAGNVNAPGREPDYLAVSREAIRRNRAKMAAVLRDMGFEVWDSAANFVFFRGESGLAERLRERGFLIRDCGNFEGLESGSTRLDGCFKRRGANQGDGSERTGDSFYRAAVRSEHENESLLQVIRELMSPEPGSICDT